MITACNTLPILGQAQVLARNLSHRGCGLSYLLPRGAGAVAYPRNPNLENWGECKNRGRKGEEGSASNEDNNDNQGG
jgi:hypothetical protein